MPYFAGGKDKNLKNADITGGGGLSPFPLEGAAPLIGGVAEAELWPRLNKAMEMLQVLGRREPFNEKASELYRQLRIGLEAYKQVLEGIGRDWNPPKLEDIMKDFFHLPDAWRSDPPGGKLFQWYDFGVDRADPRYLEMQEAIRKGTYPKVLEKKLPGRNPLNVDKYINFARLKDFVDEAEKLLGK